MSSRTVNGMPAVQTPALVEGIYQTTVRVPPATEPGVYWVYLRFGNKQVAADPHSPRRRGPFVDRRVDAP